MSSDAAAARSAALRRVELTRPRSVVGKNTVECMQAGAVFGFAGLVDGLVRRIRDDVDGFAGDDVAVVATGTPRRCCCLICVPSGITTSTSRSTGCGWCSSATATARAAGSSRPAKERADQADHAVVGVELGDQLPLVEHRAGMRDAEPEPAADLDAVALARTGRYAC